MICQNILQSTSCKKEEYNLEENYWPYPHHQDHYIDLQLENKQQNIIMFEDSHQLKELGLNVVFAQTIEISVDHRRRNLSQEELNNNVKRLIIYLSKLVLFPRIIGIPKNGVIKDSSNDVVAQPVAQNNNPEVNSISQIKWTPKRKKAIIISKELRAKNIYRRLRQEWYNAKFVGVKEKRKQVKETKN